MKDDEYMKKALAGDFELSFTEMLLHTLQMLKEQNPLSHIHTSNLVMKQLERDGFIVWEDPNIALTAAGEELVGKIEVAPTISKTYQARTGDVEKKSDKRLAEMALEKLEQASGALTDASKAVYYNMEVMKLLIKDRLSDEEWEEGK